MNLRVRERRSGDVIMKMPWDNRSGLAKAVVILSVCLMISTGLCGLNLLAVVLTHVNVLDSTQSNLLLAGYVELFIMALSAAGLVAVLIAMITESVVKHFSKKPKDAE